MVIQICIIVNKQIIYDHFFDNRMSSTFDINNTTLVDFWSAVIVLTCHQCEGNEYINLCNCLCRPLNALYICSNLIPDLTEKIIFEIDQTILGTKNGILKFFQFRSDITFRICKRLLSHVIIRNHVLERICYFQIISKHFVVFDA